MNDRETDDALLPAAERARQAEEGFVGTAPEDPAIAPKEKLVSQRAEDVNELAGDAADEAARPDG